MNKIYLLILVVLSLYSCQKSEIGRQLCATEHRMQECPTRACRELSAQAADTGRMSETEYARYSILTAESVYRRNRQVDTYHLAVAGRYYSRASFNGVCRGREVYRLLSSVWQYEKGDYLSSLQGLLSSCGNVERLSDPYLSGVLHYYLGRIYLRHRLYSRAVDSFRRERSFVVLTGDVGQQVKSDHHCALGFLAAGTLDSCRAYLAHSLMFLPRLDSLRRRMVLHNVTLLQEACFPDWDLSVVRPDSLRPFYADSVRESIRSRPHDRKWFGTHRVPDLGENVVGRLRSGVLSHLLGYRLYRDRGEYRTALRHYEHYNRFKSQFLSRLRTAEAVELVKTHEESIRAGHIRRLSGSVLVSASVAMAYLLALYRGSRQRDRCLSTALDTLRRAAGKQAEQLSSLRRDVAAETAEREKLRHRIDETERILRRDRTKLAAYRDLVVRLMFRFMMKKEGTPLSGQDFSLLVEEYAGKSSGGASLVRHLRTLPVRLSARDVFICILFHEHGARIEDLTLAIGAANRNAFKSAKSKLKARLQSVREGDAEIDRLLDRFG